MKCKSSITSIQKKLDTFTFDQLHTLFSILLELDRLSDYFMSEETHVNFINHYYSIPNIRNHETFRTFLLLTVIKYISPSKHSDLLITVELIEKKLPYEQIINTLLLQPK